MNIKAAVDNMRLFNVPHERIALVLALIEIDAHKTPYFAGKYMPDLLVSLTTFVTQKTLVYLDKVRTSDYDGEFVDFLHTFKELSFDPAKLGETWSNILKQGVENYEFKYFNRKNSDFTGHQGSPEAGQKGI